MSFIRMPLGVIMLTASMALAAPSARASDVDAKVPFSFVVNSTSLPPGKYQVSLRDESGALEMRGRTKAVFALTSHVSVPDDARPKLVFHRYGDQYVLREIWTGDGSENQLPETRREKQLSSARNGGGVGEGMSEVVIAAD